MKPTVTIRLSRKNEITACTAFLTAYAVLTTIIAATMKPTTIKVVIILFTFTVIYLTAVFNQGFEIVRR